MGEYNKMFTINSLHLRNNKTTIMKEITAWGGESLNYGRTQNNIPLNMLL